MIRCARNSGFLLVTLLAATTAVAASAAEAAKSPADYVEPRIDTHKSRWFYFSSACRPFGMVNLSPDTRTGDDWMHGYMYGDTKIRCFSHIHGWQLYGIAVLPVIGEVPKPWDMDATAAEFSNKDEVVHPGYHKVVLTNYGITAELTSTTRVGFHRYQFPNDQVPKVIFNTGATLHGPDRRQRRSPCRPRGFVGPGRDGPYAAAAETIHRAILRGVRPADRKTRRLGREQTAVRPGNEDRWQERRGVAHVCQKRQAAVDEGGDFVCLHLQRAR